jgi:hypothetical protein
MHDVKYVYIAASAVAERCIDQIDGVNWLSGLDQLRGCKAAFGRRTSRNAKVLYCNPAQIDWVAHACPGCFDDTLSNDFGYSISAVTYLKRPSGIFKLPIASPRKRPSWHGLRCPQRRR